MSDERITLWNLEREIQREVDSYLRDAPEDRQDAFDFMFDVADSHTPMMHETAIRLVMENMRLWNVEPEREIGDSPTPAKICTAVIFDHLMAYGLEHLHDEEDRIEEERQDAEAMRRLDASEGHAERMSEGLEP